MRLRLDFGINGSRKEVSWYEELSLFPTALYFEGEVWEWIMYQDDPNGHYDKILSYGLLKQGDPRWSNYVDFYDRFGGQGWGYRCECGSAYSSAPQFHMFYCPMWRKQ